MLTNSSRFDPRVIKLQTKIYSDSGKEETAWAIFSDNTHIAGVSLVKIVSEKDLKFTLEYIMKKDNPDDKYGAFARESVGEGYMRFSIEEARTRYPWSHLFIEIMKNQSKYRHVGMALHEFALRYSLMSGNQGRIRESASWSSHVFHRKCGYSPGNYADTQEVRIKNENEIDEKIRSLQKIQKADGNRVDTTSLGGVDMYLCEDQIKMKKEKFGILSDELAIPPENFVTASEFLGLKPVAVESKETVSTLEEDKAKKPEALPKEEKIVTPILTVKNEVHEKPKAAPLKCLPSSHSPVLLKCLPVSLLEVKHSYFKMSENKEADKRLEFVVGDLDQAIIFYEAIKKIIGEQHVQITYDLSHNKSCIAIEKESKAVLKHLGIEAQSTEFSKPYLHNIQFYAQQRLNEKEYQHSYGRLFGQSKSVKLAASLLALAYPEKTLKELSQNKKIQGALSHGELGKTIKGHQHLNV